MDIELCTPHTDLQRLQLVPFVLSFPVFKANEKEWLTGEAIRGRNILRIQQIFNK